MKISFDLPDWLDVLEINRQIFLGEPVIVIRVYCYIENKIHQKEYKVYPEEWIYLNQIIERVINAFKDYIENERANSNNRK